MYNWSGSDCRHGKELMGIAKTAVGWSSLHLQEEDIVENKQHGYEECIEDYEDYNEIIFFNSHDRLPLSTPRVGD
jgi:hypothetical protein